jgi:hypothetical protein
MSVDFELVFEDEVSDLFHLVGFRFVSERLQIENFLHPGFVENDVTSTSLTAGEAAAFEKVAEIGKGDV